MKNKNPLSDHFTQSSDDGASQENNLEPHQTYLANLVNDLVIETSGFQDVYQSISKKVMIYVTILMVAMATIGYLINWLLIDIPLSNLKFYLISPLLLAFGLAYFKKTHSFENFCLIQLGLLLFSPFAMQWQLGSYGSILNGVLLWSLLAPVSAVLVLGAKESIPWIFAWVFFSVLSGVFDIIVGIPIASMSSDSIQVTILMLTINVTGVALVVYIMLCYVANLRAIAQEKVENAHDRLKKEQKRSEALLLNILPENIAERLKYSDEPVADGFSDVTVMFADLVTFTELASHQPPQEIFAMLNKVFSEFDELAEKHKLEKIKTIGDAYMVAGGLNDQKNNYTERIACLALDMIETMSSKAWIDPRLGQLRLRVGISTGPIVAGVVGKKKFIYDLWGNTVNIASRLSSTNCEPNTIQCEEVTWRRLQDLFRFEGPFPTPLKGKGEVNIYRLTG